MIRLNQEGKAEFVELDKSTPIRTIHYSIYALNIYSEFNNQSNYIVGVRTSQGMGNDSHQIVIMDKDTLEVMATMDEPHLTIGFLADILQSIVTKLVPNAKILVERNGAGVFMIDELLSRNLEEMLIYKETTGGKIYGIDLDKTVVDTTRDIISDIIRNIIHIIKTEMVVDEMCEYMENNGKIPLFGICVFASKYYK